MGNKDPPVYSTQDKNLQDFPKASFSPFQSMQNRAGFGAAQNHPNFPHFCAKAQEKLIFMIFGSILQ